MHREGTHDCQNPEDPHITNMLCDEAKEEWTDRNSKSDQHGPDTNILAPFFLKKALSDDTCPDGTGRAQKEGNECSTGCHGGVAVTEGTSDIEETTT